MAEDNTSRPLLSLLLDGVVQLAKQALRERWSEVQAHCVSERDQLLKVLITSALALMLIGLGVLMLMAWVLVLCWDVCGPQLLAAFGAVLVGVGAWLLDRTRLQARRKN